MGDGVTGAHGTRKQIKCDAAKEPSNSYIISEDRRLLTKHLPLTPQYLRSPLPALEHVIKPQPLRRYHTQVVFSNQQHRRAYIIDVRNRQRFEQFF